MKLANLQIMIQHSRPAPDYMIGGKVIQPFNLPHLTSGLPYKLVTRGATYGALPSQLSFSITFAFKSVNAWGFAAPSLFATPPVTLPMATLNNEKVTVSYKPATAADEQTLASLLPAGQITDITQLPSNIPAYLIHVIPELKINGQVVMTGSAVQMGTDHKVKYTINYPDGRIGGYSSNFIAGEFQAVGVVGGSISKNKFTNLQAKASQLKTDLESGFLTNVTKESTLGDMFYSGILGYFLSYQTTITAQKQRAKVDQLLLPSIGTYGTKNRVRYFFGFPRSMRLGGAGVDIGNLAYVVTSFNGDSDIRRGFIMNAGMLSSSLEHAVLEKMFSTISKPVEGVSAAKLLSLATAKNIPVYHITVANSQEIIPKLKLSSYAIKEIKASISAGKEVTAHQRQIAVGGWLGEGYTIIDPVVGDGAYRISGGFNGGALEYPYADGISIGLLLIGLLTVLTGGIAGALFAVVLAIQIYHTFMLTIIIDLDLRLSGCPEGLSYLLYAMSAVLFSLPKVLKHNLFTWIAGFYGFMTRGTVSASASACGKF